MFCSIGCLILMFWRSGRQSGRESDLDGQMHLIPVSLNIVVSDALEVEYVNKSTMQGR